MLIRKHFLFDVCRSRGHGAAGWIVRRGPDTAWTLILWHSLPVPFVVQIGWAPKGAEFSAEWDRLDEMEAPPSEHQMLKDAIASRVDLLEREARQAGAERAYDIVIERIRKKFDLSLAEIEARFRLDRGGRDQSGKWGA